MSNKKTGSYYTPKPIANFMVKYVLSNIKDKNISILEPSVGDGVFVESIDKISFSQFKEKSLTLIDINKKELHKAKNKINSNFGEIKIHNNDFLKYQQKCTDRFSLIIGNPPYINKKLLSKETVDLCKRIHCESNLSNNAMSNIWTAFVVSSIKLLEPNGIMAFVLPYDILQVKYAEEIRQLLESSFDRIEILTLKTSDFPEIEQQTVILIAYKDRKNTGTYFYHINDIENGSVIQVSSNGLMVSQKKWTHNNLSFEDVKLLNKITFGIPKVSDYVDVSAGIVTGANKYFIQSQSVINEYKLNEFALPILSKGSLLKKGIELSKAKYDKLIKSDKRTFLISMNENSKLNIKNKDYIKIGEDQELSKRHKCSLRKKWYCVPNISTPPKAFIFKRCHSYPKLIKNSAKVYVTDTAYRVNPKGNIDIKSFIFSFYNIVTLIYAELMGRKYGGGVLELTPNEFRELPIYYKEINNRTFNNLAKLEEDNNNNNFAILNEYEKYQPNISEGELKQLEIIYAKLIYSRI